MLRLVLLLLYLVASYSSFRGDTGQNLDPDGLDIRPSPTGDTGQNLDPNG